MEVFPPLPSSKVTERSLFFHPKFGAGAGAESPQSYRGCSGQEAAS